VAKVLKCGAIFLGCGHIIQAQSEEEVMRLAAQHAKEVHGLEEIDEKTADTVRSLIATE
jgi:predicted small metal-binding protein